MTKFITKLIFFLILTPLLSSGQITQKVWYDGNSRAMFYRDALSGDLKNIDTTSTRSEGEGYTAIDLGMHFTPNDKIEIFSKCDIISRIEYFEKVRIYFFVSGLIIISRIGSEYFLTSYI